MFTFLWSRNIGKRFLTLKDLHHINRIWNHCFLSLLMELVTSCLLMVSSPHHLGDIGQQWGSECQCWQPCQCAHSCSLLLTPAHSCSLLLTPVHSCSLLFTSVHSCSLLLTSAHFCSLLCSRKGFAPPQSWKLRAESMWATQQRTSTDLAEDTPSEEGQVH